MYNQEWGIKPRALVCKICTTPFTGGQICVSSLRVNGSEYERADCCENCWKQNAPGDSFRPVPKPQGEEPVPSPLGLSSGRRQGEESVRENAFSVWRGIFQAESLPPEVLKKETAESLLRKLIEKNDPQYRNSIFILAVMLERRRILAEKEVQKKDALTMIRVYEHRKTGEIFIVSDPMLSLDQLGHVQEEVSALLSGSEAMPVAEDKKDV